MRHFFIFFSELVDLLKAIEWEPKQVILNHPDSFIVDSWNTFLLWNSVECENKIIEASKKEPLFGSSVSYMLDSLLKGEKHKQTFQKVKIIMEEFKSQDFYKSAVICNKHSLLKKYLFEIEGGAKRIKGAQYFPWIHNMCKFCYNNRIINKLSLNKPEKELLNSQLKISTKGI